MTVSNSGKELRDHIIFSNISIIISYNIQVLQYNEYVVALRNNKARYLIKLYYG
jgi:hypothetical protein